MGPPGLTRWIVRAAVSATVVAVLLTFVPFAAVRDALARVSVWAWVASLAVFVGGHYFNAVKLRLLLGGAAAPMAACVQAQYAGLAANLGLPGLAGGDLVRAAYLVPAVGVKRVTIATVADRILDTLTLIVLVAIALPLAGAPPMIADLVWRGGWWIAAAVAGAAAVAVVVVRMPRFARVTDMIAQAWRELRAREFALAGAVAISFLVQPAFVLTNVWLARQVGVDTGLAAWFVAWPLSKLVAVLPISLGGIGVREAVLVSLLAPYGAASDAVLASGILWQGVLAVSGVGGLIVTQALRARAEARAGHPEAGALAPADQPGLPFGELRAPRASRAVKARPPSATDAPPSFVILGGGPAGLAAAYKLAQRGWRNVTVLERGSRVGGNAGSFVLDGIPVDFGSHRLHPTCPPAVMADIRQLLGDDLLDRPRHGRIRLRGRWVHFPLKPLDLLRRLPPSFMAGVLGDAIRKRFAREDADPSFASILERGLGRTICRDFYFPYAQKIWGLAPDALDPEQAKRRVSSGSIGKMIRRVIGAVPGLRRPGAGRFFYPRNGYGQISDAFHAAAAAAGAHVRLNTKVTKVLVARGRVTGVEIEAGGATRTFPATHVLSTIPLTVLARLVRADVAPPVAAAEALQLRAMVLVYLTLEAEQFTEFDAHYFPETAIRITRLSEPKNYSLTVRPGRTVLCAELPCTLGGAEWSMSDAALGDLVCRDLDRAGLGPVRGVSAVHVERLPHAYPLYTRGYREAFDVLDRWAGGIDGLVTFGRQGLFAHDNTHHTMGMAYALVDCLGDDGAFDREAWARARKSFESHVVED